MCLDSGSLNLDFHVTLDELIVLAATSPGCQTVLDCESRGNSEPPQTRKHSGSQVELPAGGPVAVDMRVDQERRCTNFPDCFLIYTSGPSSCAYTRSRLFVRSGGEEDTVRATELTQTFLLACSRSV